MAYISWLFIKGLIDYVSREDNIYSLLMIIQKKTQPTDGRNMDISHNTNWIP